MKPSPETSGVLAQAWRMLAGDPGTARRVAKDLLRASPVNPDATLLLAAASRRLGEIGTARDLLAPLMTTRTSNEAAWFEWGMILSATGEDMPAADALRRAVRLKPGFVNAWRALGDQLILLGSGPEAGRAYAHAAGAGVRDPRLSAAGAALAEGRNAAAEALLRAHVRGFPGDVRAWHLLAEAVMRLGGVTEALALLERCLAAAARFSEARHSLAILLYTQRRFGEAAGHFKMLLAAAPHQPCLRVLLAICLIETGDFENVVPLYEAMLAGFRDQPATWLRYGHALKTLGRETEAIGAYRVCIALAPPWSAGAYLSLADVKTSRFTDDEMEAMHRALGHANVTPIDASQLHYALGHASEQRGAYREAFQHFSEGARLRRQTIAYDAGETTAFVTASRAVFTAPFFANRRGAGCNSAAPIFIVGLPRSGSTLVEQILASHKAVEGTSELREIGRIAAELRGDRAPSALPAIVAGLDAATLTKLGERYLANTAQVRRQDRPHFTDKMPDNFLHTGLIHAILPYARIIDIRRQPLAAGFASFKQFFQLSQTGQDYSYDLGEIGRYYRDYEALMAHFAAVLPGRVHLLHYERLVTDTEHEVRRLLDFCGLDFDPACLRFWETARSVQTPSAQQVRRPISQDGLEHWRHYEEWLGPLREALRVPAQTR